MKFFIVDDDINIIRILEEIIEEERLGEVTGYALDGKTRDERNHYAES